MSDSEINLDFDRENRTGLAEAIFCSGKSTTQLLTICRRIIEQNKPMLFTRLDADSYAEIEAAYPSMLDYDPVSRSAIHQGPAVVHDMAVAVVTGGSSDVPVAREAARTLAYYGYKSLEIDDVGVAGLWRITNRLPELRQVKIAICIAGMDAALPTVLGGLIPGVIIAVPTSVGYGMVKGGETALRSLLVSCAPGITVVNIDNGYGAACAAIRVLNQIGSTR
ncbi:MAG: nickel pincer cofactor biosynthesis protein LarB [Proteobacteria bacterium]|jgi:NCAIR mutase (PurE)-related protein|nr:nickel pincer cofactor biosynthesis protein LarB [Pseudomonadota bacterium]MDA1301034.1 nickel pincer cofactor biosynthesis protein LarB [Pseudomonadota bacterium]